MKKLILLFLILIPTWIFACMPPFPWEVMVWRINSITQSASWMIGTNFSTYQFPFRNYEYENPTSWHWNSPSLTIFPDIQTWSLIIALADYQDGSYPTNYSIFHITTLSCKDDTIKLGKRYGWVMWWDRKNGKCGYQAHSLLDVFIEWDEALWLKKLQEKYPTCDSLEKTFPVKQDIIIDNTKTPSLENHVVIYSTWFPWLDWLLSKIDNLFKLF